MIGKKPDTPKTVLHMRRGFVPEQPNGVFYREKRGLHEVTLGGPSKDLQIGGRSASQTAVLMQRGAERLLSGLGEPGVVPTLDRARIAGSNNPIEEENRALLDRYARVAAKHGIVSLPAFAAQFQGIFTSLLIATIDMLRAASPAMGEDELTEKAVAHMKQIQEFANVWHYLHMDLFKEHELAFAKVQHKAAAARGVEAVKTKKEERNDIVRDHANRFRANTTDPEKLTPALIARRIRVETLAAFKKADLKCNYNDATFEKIVRRALSDEA
jgi:hypothetical protein